MRLNNTELYQFFKEKNIDYLYHANTVATSISFIRAGGLMSRGCVEARNLYQTPQRSDAKDREVGVWNDIFLDTVDLHGYFPRQNYYGPLVFKFSVDLVLNINYEIWITKANPEGWSVSLGLIDRYFGSVQELRDNWDNYATQQKMITIRNNAEPILFEHLVSSLLDDPGRIISNRNILMDAVNSLRLALCHHENLRGKFKVRQNHSCYCYDNYLNQHSEQEIIRLFLPND